MVEARSGMSAGALTRGGAWLEASPPRLHPASSSASAKNAAGTPADFRTAPIIASPALNPCSV
jgi:hypothetical protein